MHKASLAVVLAIAVCGTAAAAQPNLQTDKDKTLYAIGIALGSNVHEFSLTPQELALVEAGFGDAALGKHSRVDMQAFGPRIQAFANERVEQATATEKKASTAFIDKMAKTAHAERTASGLVYIPIKSGPGPMPKSSDTVSVSYVGSFRDGTVFDSTAAHGGKPDSFPLDGVIQCWTEGLQKMKVGGKAKLVCPSSLAYGDKGKGPIPGGAALVFEVQLLGIGAPAPQQPQPQSQK
jgi:FKBP-type peptidyl-prolyl cis-trans isomerase FkpA